MDSNSNWEDIDLLWNECDFTWNDIAIVEEIVNNSGGSSSNYVSSFHKLAKQKQKRVVELICYIKNNDKIYNSIEFDEDNKIDIQLINEKNIRLLVEAVEKIKVSVTFPNKNN